MQAAQGQGMRWEDPALSGNRPLLAAFPHTKAAWMRDIFVMYSFSIIALFLISNQTTWTPWNNVYSKNMIYTLKKSWIFLSSKCLPNVDFAWAKFCFACPLLAPQYVPRGDLGASTMFVPTRAFLLTKKTHALLPNRLVRQPFLNQSSKGVFLLPAFFLPPHISLLDFVCPWEWRNGHLFCKI